MDEFFESLWTIEQNEFLERKAWFRFLKIVNLLAILFMILSTILIGWLVYDNSKVLISASVACNDGTKWNAMKNNRLLESDALCGVCTQRSPDTSFTLCSYGSIDYNSYDLVDQKYRHTATFMSFFVYPVIYMFVGLLIIKAVVKGIVYIVAGNTPPSVNHRTHGETD